MSEDSQKDHYSSATHQHVQHSSTLNRRYVKRPERLVQADDVQAVQISSFAKRQAEDLRRRQELAEKINRERLASMKKGAKLQRGYVSAQGAEQEAMATQEKKIAVQEKSNNVAIKKEEMMPAQEHPIQKAANARIMKGWETTAAKQKTAQELKNEAIEKAMRSVATMDAKEQKAGKKAKRAHKKMSAGYKKRLALAFATAVAAVGAIGYFVAVNLPDVSVRVTAIQSGIENPYPGYIPRGFTLATSSAGDDAVSLTFASGEKSFTLSEEKSAWDSKALLANYVDINWTKYDTIKEQGLTIYISGSNAAWVNGGVRYVIEAANGTLTSKQIKNIAASL